MHVAYLFMCYPFGELLFCYGRFKACKIFFILEILMCESQRSKNPTKYAIFQAIDISESCLLSDENFPTSTSMLLVPHLHKFLAELGVIKNIIFEDRTQGINSCVQFHVYFHVHFSNVLVNFFSISQFRICFRRF